MKFLLPCLMLFFLASPMYAQEVEVKRERTFTASGLYGFMNGGADQFLEYDVQKLTVREILYKGEEYSVEIYEMLSPEDAFGIYSLHTFRCMRADTLNCIDCMSPYQLQAVSGIHYVSVVFPSGSKSAQTGADELIRKYVSMPDKNMPVIPSVLNLKPPYSGNLKYLRGPLSVSTASFSFSGLLEGISYKGIWFIQKKASEDYQALILADKENIEKIKKKLSPADIIQENETSIFMKGIEAEQNDSGLFGF